MSISAILIVAGAVLIWRRATSPAVEKKNDIAFILPEEIVLAEESIPLTWTDNNEDENLIIKSDRQYYDGRDSSEVYFSITNISGQDQDTSIIFWFDSAEKKVMSVERVGSEEIPNPKLQITNKFQIPNSNPPAGGPNRKDIKDYTDGSKFSDEIAAGQINYYKAIIKYPASENQSEFFIEAIGDKNGYGHLDPYLAGGLVGMWTFNGADTTWSSATAGTTNDLSGNGNTGTMTNMSRTTSPAPGISGQALSFDGTDDRVDTQNFMSSGVTAFTLQAWVYKSATKDARIIYKNNAGNTGHPVFGLASGGDDLLRCRMRVADTTGIDYSAGTIPLNTWTFVACVYDGSYVRNYLNGTLQGTPQAKTGTLAATDDVVVIGQNETGTSVDRHWPGLIDEARVYNRALSADEILELYRVGARRVKIRQ